MAVKKITVNGVVQGVGFRPFVYREAAANNLKGTVKNLGDAGVEIIIQGSPDDIDQFLESLKTNRPPLAKIENFFVENLTSPPQFTDFTILKSGSEGKGSGTIPPDTATCSKCLQDILTDSRYQNYWATSCVDCGPRFTVIEELPYDRVRTSMKEFPLCEECEKEYKDPENRRYHAQAIACPKCGPSLFFDSQSSGSPIQKAARCLKEGKILAIKGIGGTHIACDGTREKVVSTLRSRLNRPSQPLAVMATEKMLKKIAAVDKKEMESLKSLRRPIVILDKQDNSPLAPSVAPGLHNVGVMLPYSGLHHLLFAHIDFPLVMTSANFPGQPMLIDNQETKKELENIVDHFLLHNRRIVSRCDDSVVRFSGGTRRFLRKSRGWAPSVTKIELDCDPILALGAELDNTISLYADGKCYTSQYIGDIDDVRTYEYLNQTIEHLLNITGQSLPRHVACDCHPRFLTTRLAEKLGKKVTHVQHHHAHAAKVLGEHGLDESVALTLDGVGYGQDGRIWGGEVLVTKRSGFKKVGGLSDVYMPGGDLATKYPGRMVAGILYAGGLRKKALQETLENNLKPYGKKNQLDFNNIIKQLESGINVPQTSSAGRFLDAVSALLGICQVRTYEGEPAMKLESVASGAEPIDLNPKFITQENQEETQGIPQDGKKFLHTPALFRQIMKLKGSHSTEEVAATAQYNLACGLAQLALEQAKKRHIGKVSLSGGVAYNQMISTTIREEIEKVGLLFYTNSQFPSGDGGISFGQIMVAAEDK